MGTLNLPKEDLRHWAKCKGHFLAKSDGQWTARSLYNLPHNRVLEIQTRKSLSAYIYTRASIHQIENGCVTFAIGDDYSARIIRHDAVLKATEKTIGRLHEKAMADKEAITAHLNAILVKYRAKEATENANKFLAKKPELIGVVSDIDFYEDPDLGDETPLLAWMPDGRMVRSDWYELPAEEELADWTQITGEPDVLAQIEAERQAPRGWEHTG